MANAHRLTGDQVVEAWQALSAHSRTTVFRRIAGLLEEGPKDNKGGEVPFLTQMALAESQRSDLRPFDGSCQELIDAILRGE